MKDKRDLMSLFSRVLSYMRTSIEDDVRSISDDLDFCYASLSEDNPALIAKEGNVYFIDFSKERAL